MLKEINKGNMVDGQFNSDTWKKMLATLNELGKRSFTMTQFKGKFNRMCLLHCEFSTPINQTGFGWNAETNTIHALEKSWQSYCPVNIFEYNTMFYFDTLFPIIFFLIRRLYIFRHIPRQKCFKPKDFQIIIFLDLYLISLVLHCASIQETLNSDEENALEELLIHGGVHVNLESLTQDPIMAILDIDITTRLSNHLSDSCDECPSKSKQDIISSQMNDAL